MMTSVTDQVKQAIEKEILTDLSAVELTANLEDDLGIDPVIDYPRLVTKLVKKFSLNSDGERLLKTAATLQQIIDIIQEETELG